MANIDIKFIAKKSGCSIATVSRVINRSKPVSEKLQKREKETNWIFKNQRREAE